MSFIQHITLLVSAVLCGLLNAYILLPMFLKFVSERVEWNGERDKKQLTFVFCIVTGCFYGFVIGFLIRSLS